MDMKNLTKTQKLAVSGAVMAIYIVIMYFTQSFAFGQYQVRIATAIYGCAYLFPFLVVPLGLSNLLANMVMGGLGFFDIVGGGLVGLLTAFCCALLGRKRVAEWSVIAPITLIPALGVSLWLSALLGVPYWTLAVSLLIGQAVAGFVGALLVKALKRVWKEK
ncbi:MAG: QueT transporter family protein [Clostridia bacterium]|nr:QueT transporter family protein [Clostridia bacterium]